MENDIGPRREAVEEIRRRQGNHADADADGNDHQVIRAVKFDLTQGPDTASDDHAVLGNAGAA